MRLRHLALYSAPSEIVTLGPIKASIVGDRKRVRINAIRACLRNLRLSILGNFLAGRNSPFRTVRSLAFVLFSLLLFQKVEASFVGCPANPSTLEEGFFISDRCWSSIHAAISGDVLFNKRLKPCRSSGHGISHSEMNWSLAACDFGWDIRERASFHLLAGPAIATTIRWRQENEAITASSSQGAFWGASAKLIVLEIKDTALGVDFHGGGIEWMHGPLTVNQTSASTFSSRMYFWQIAAGLSQNAGIFRPYAAGVVDRTVSIVRPHQLKKRRFHDLVHTGIVEGCSFTVGSRILLNVEARQFFESGITLSGEVRF